MKFLGLVVLFAICASSIAFETEEEFPVDNLEYDVEYDEEYGFRDLWDKVKAAARKLGPQIKSDVVSVLKDYKPKILDALKKAGKVVIQAGKDWVIEVRDGIVKIIADGKEGTSTGDTFEGEDSPIYIIYDSPNSKAGDKIKEVWHKVQDAFRRLGQKIKDAAIRLGAKIAGLGGKVGESTAEIRAKIAKIAKDYGQKILATLNQVLDKYKDIIVDALTKDGKVIIQEGRTIVIEIVKDVVQVIVDGIHALGGKYEISSEDEEEYDVKEVWEKVKAAIRDYAGRYKEEIKKLAEKYKPRIIAELQKFKKVLITEGKGLLIEMLGDAIKIIIRGGIGDVPQYGFSDIWAKIKDTVQKLQATVVEDALKVLSKYKPKILDAVKDAKQVVIACGKELVIQVRDGIIKVIAEGSSATSDDSSPEDYRFEEGYAMVIFSDDEGDVAYGIKDSWAKVKDAFKRLGEKIKSKSIDLWKKIIPVAGPVIEKYKALIIKALENNGKVIINEGKKIVITVINDVVKVVIDGMDAMSGKITYDDEDENGFKDIWAKVKRAAKKLPGVMKAATEKILKKYKPKIIEALKKVGEVAVEAGKKIMIKIKDNVVHIFVDGKEVASSS